MAGRWKKWGGICQRTQSCSHVRCVSRENWWSSMMTIFSNTELNPRNFLRIEPSFSHHTEKMVSLWKDIWSILTVVTISLCICILHLHDVYLKCIVFILKKEKADWANVISWHTPSFWKFPAKPDVWFYLTARNHYLSPLCSVSVLQTQPGESWLFLSEDIMPVILKINV